MQVHRNIHSVRQPIKSGMQNCYENFRNLANAWSPLIEKRRATHPQNFILCEMSEDETGIMPLLQYCEDTDSIVGSCGWSGDNHKCNPDFAPKIGDDWNNLVRIMKGSVASTYARVIMVNPLVTWLKPSVVYINATCNKFDHAGHFGDVASQWEATLVAFYKYLHPLGLLFIGRGSDGDARRYVLQHATWSANATKLEALTLVAKKIQGIWRRFRLRRHQRLTAPPAHATPLRFSGWMPISLSSMTSSTAAPGFTFAAVGKYSLRLLLDYY